LRDFRQHGQKAVARVRQRRPDVYLKILALLCPREHRAEHTDVIKSLSDQELEAMVEYLKTSLEAQARGSERVIEGRAELTAVEATALPLLESPKPKSRVMLEADTSIGPRRMRPPPGA
jgi:hypothetical protein